MKNVLARLIHVDKNKDITKAKIINSFNKGSDTRRYEILVELVKLKAKPIGFIGTKIFKLEEIKNTNAIYKFKYSGEKFNSKEMLTQLTSIDYSEFRRE